MANRVAACLTCSAERPDGESGATMVTQIATSMQAGSRQQQQQGRPDTQSRPWEAGRVERRRQRLLVDSLPRPLHELRGGVAVITIAHSQLVLAHPPARVCMLTNEGGHAHEPQDLDIFELEDGWDGFSTPVKETYRYTAARDHLLQLAGAGTLLATSHRLLRSGLQMLVARFKERHGSNANESRTRAERHLLASLLSASLLERTHDDLDPSCGTHWTRIEPLASNP